MPKVSKVKMPEKTAAKSRGRPPVPKTPEPLGHFVCTRCGRDYRQQRNNYSASQSPLWEHNGCYVPVCSACVGVMFNQYKRELGTDEAAARRLCMKFDYYWSDRLFATVKSSAERLDYLRAEPAALMRAYLSKCNLLSFRGKTFDDTLRDEAEKNVDVVRDAVERSEKQIEEEVKKRVEEEIERRVAAGECPEGELPKEEIEVIDEPNPEDVEFWGDGYTVTEYDVLNKKYEQWIDQAGDADEDGNVPIGTSTLLRQICTLDLQIGRNINAGKPIEASVKQLNDLIGSVNARPSQTKERNDETDGSFDSLPFGVGIRIFENSRPVPKPLPQLEDVDGIVRYISIWFLGHLCKMLHIKNTYCKLYEDEIARLRVERPELENEDDETVFNNIFGDNPS